MVALNIGQSFTESHWKMKTWYYNGNNNKKNTNYNNNNDIKKIIIWLKVCIHEKNMNLEKMPA